jgi:hypothetical protein
MKNKNSVDYQQQQISYGLTQCPAFIKCLMKTFSVIYLSIISFSYTHAQVISTFDDPDISQWILEGDGVLLHNATNGLPGGCLHFDDPASGVIAVMTISPEYFGSWNDDNQEISFDMKVGTSDNDLIENFAWVIEISGPGGTAQALPNYLPALNVWLQVEVPINSADWTVVSGNWEDILENVNQVRLRVEFISGVEDVYFDNVTLSFTPGQNEISGDVCSDFETYGFDGWTFASVSSASYAETSGNPGGAVTIGDQSNQISLGFAPWKFLGDWSVLGANATFQFDIRVNASASLYMNKEFLVKITGSGGTAIIPPDYVEIAEAKNQWKTFSFPVNPGTWTVTSGTWEGLMNGVQQLVLELEFIQGGETVLIDNVCLITDNLPACIAEGGVITPASITLCAKDKYTMTSTGYTDDPAATYQWMISTTSGGPYSNVVDGTGATTPSYETDKLKKGTFYYVMQTTCPSQGTDLSNELVLDVKAFPTATITPAGPFNLCKGESVLLTAPNDPNRSYQWEKKNEDIAGATNMVFEASTKGNYKVTVTNITTGCKNTSAAVKINVYDDPVATITPQGPTTFCEGGSVVLQANTGAGLAYKWRKGSNYISGATLSSYTATTQGNYKVEVTDVNGCTKTSEVTEVTVPCKLGTGTRHEVTIYPNPASAEVNISLPAGEDFDVELISVTGERIFRAENQSKIDLSNLAAGIYFIQISTADYISTQKLVKQ